MPKKKTAKQSAQFKLPENFVGLQVTARQCGGLFPQPMLGISMKGVTPSKS
jgi:hypothetical protein